MLLPRVLRSITSHPLNRDHKGEAILRFLKWQIGSRLVSGPVVHNWIGGARMIMARGESGLTLNLYCGLFEFADMAFILHVLNPEDVFVDVGANAGAYTLLATAVKGARTFSFEPVPSTYARLMDNVRLNDLGERVQAFNLGLSDREGELAFTSDNSCRNHVVASGETPPSSVSLKVVPLDAALAGQSPAVLKIDVEGFERPVLDGARRLLGDDSLHSVIIEVNGSGQRYGFADDDIVQRMRRFGFGTYTYDPFRRVLAPHKGVNDEAGNMLFVRNESLVKERVAKAPRIVIGRTQL
jgi:FkbM family methyltransferase